MKTLAVRLAGPHAARFWRCTLVLLLCVVTWLALAPGAPQVPGSLLGWDKLHHLAAFAVLAVVAGLGFPAASAPVLAGLLAFGALIEMLQSLTPNRHASWADLVADLLGIVLGVMIARGLVARAASAAAPVRR
ncbi:VanZ family protein [Caldimonas tepidiphila]|uniref:VanZ family protein n=1 Tax=Caldimonas tepidiphila TaxID=2315841 RepID=UPI000E5A5E07|nr:VanZ family protein [Caldimonas tepidiphila]